MRFSTEYTRVWIATLLALTMLAGEVFAAGSPHVDAADILQEIRASGAAKVVARLYDSGALWNGVLARIGQGSDDWLKVAVALHPGTDGGAAEELNEAIFFALATAPKKVLELLRIHEFNVDFVCSSNVSVDYSFAESRQFIDERLRVLGQTHEPALAQITALCTRGLQQALRDVDRPEAEH